MSQITGCVAVLCHLRVNHVIYKPVRITHGKLETGVPVSIMYEIVLCSVKEMMEFSYPALTVIVIQDLLVPRVVSVRPTHGRLVLGEHVQIISNLVASLVSAVSDKLYRTDIVPQQNQQQCRVVAVTPTHGRLVPGALAVAVNKPEAFHVREVMGRTFQFHTVVIVVPNQQQCRVVRLTVGIDEILLHVAQHVMPQEM